MRYRLGGGRLVWDEGDPENGVVEEAGGQAQSLNQILRVLRPTGVLAPGEETALAVQFRPGQVGEVHAQFDLAIERAEGGAGQLRQAFFDNECDADVQGPGEGASQGPGG